MQPHANTRIDLNYKRRGSPTGQWRAWFVYFCVALLVFLPMYSGGDLRGEDTRRWRVFLEWQPVQFAFGYIVQLKNARGEVIDMRMIQGANRMALELTPGEYQHRITALNMFHRKTGWSKWKKFTVSENRTKNRIPAGVVDNRPRGVVAKRRVRNSSDKLPLWQKLIPGLPELHEGRNISGYAYSGLTGLALVTGLFAWTQNMRLANSSEALTSIYGDSTTYLLLRDQLLTRPDLQGLAFAARESNLRDRAAYSRNRSLQVGAALVGLVVYFLHIKSQFWNTDGISRVETPERRTEFSLSIHNGPRKERGARMAIHVHY